MSEMLQHSLARLEILCKMSTSDRFIGGNYTITAVYNQYRLQTDLKNGVTHGGKEELVTLLSESVRVTG